MNKSCGVAMRLILARLYKGILIVFMSTKRAIRGLKYSVNTLRAFDGELNEFNIHRLDEPARLSSKSLRYPISRTAGLPSQLCSPAFSDQGENVPPWAS